MTIYTQTQAIKKLFGELRPESRYVPGIAAGVSVITAVALLSALPGSTVTNWAITGNVDPLVEAGGTSQPVVGFLQFGVVRVYIPLLSLLLVLGGELAAVFIRRWGMVIAMAAGASAGAQPIVLSGCGCGYGTASTTLSLLEQVMEIGLL